jgi:hypothetical protein
MLNIFEKIILSKHLTEWILIYFDEKDSIKLFFVDKWIKPIKNSFIIKYRAYNEFISHKVTYFLCLINEFRLYAWKK